MWSTMVPNQIFFLLRVLQGFILEHLLFLINTDDLHWVNHVFCILLYADDTTLALFDGDNSETILNNKLCKISDWLSPNKLFFNVKET